MSKMYEQGILRGKANDQYTLKAMLGLISKQKTQIKTRMWKKKKKRPERDTNLHPSDWQKLRYLTILHVGENVDQKDLIYF